MGLRLDDAHDIIERKFGVPIIADGQDLEGVAPPFIAYTFIAEQRYREYQVPTLIATTSGSVRKLYMNPTETHVQYTLAEKSDKIVDARDAIRQIYNFLTTDGFRNALRNLPYNLRFKIVSDIRELSIPRGHFYERHLSFDVKWLWLDVTDEDASGSIESAEAVFSLS